MVMRHEAKFELRSWSRQDWFYFFQAAFIDLNWISSVSNQMNWALEKINQSARRHSTKEKQSVNWIAFSPLACLFFLSTVIDFKPMPRFESKQPSFILLIKFIFWRSLIKFAGEEWKNNPASNNQTSVSVWLPAPRWKNDWKPPECNWNKN